jgi:hypothetical protein
MCPEDDSQTYGHGHRSRLDNETAAAANEAVKAALAAFAKQPWYITAYARIRFAIYWATYWIRLQIGAHLVYRFGCDENKTFRRLGL